MCQFRRKEFVDATTKTDSSSSQFESEFVDETFRQEFHLNLDKLRRDDAREIVYEFRNGNINMF